MWIDLCLCEEKNTSECIATETPDLLEVGNCPVAGIHTSGNTGSVEIWASTGTGQVVDAASRNSFFENLIV